MAGYAHDKKQLSSDLRARIVAELSSKKPRSAFSGHAQELFIEEIAAAVAYFRRTTSESRTDRDLRVPRIDRLALSASNLQAAHKALFSEDGEVFGDIVSHRGDVVSPALAPLLETIAQSASDLAASHRRFRGEHDVVPGPMKFFVSQVATAWQHCFGRRATAAGAFASVIAEIILEMGEKPLGRDALRSILDKRG